MILRGKKAVFQILYAVTKGFVVVVAFCDVCNPVNMTLKIAF